MKCPKCSKEIDDQDLFCGFCGTKIERLERQTKKKKRKIGIKIFIFFALIAMLSGTALGFCMARGIIDSQELTKKNKFQWTDFSEATTEPDTSKDEEVEKEEKKSETKELKKDKETSKEDSIQED